MRIWRWIIILDILMNFQNTLLRETVKAKKNFENKEEFIKGLGIAKEKLTQIYDDCEEFQKPALDMAINIIDYTINIESEEIQHGRNKEK